MLISFSIIVIVSISIVSGLILGWAAVRFKLKSNPVVDQIESILPQTQCSQCGYPGCRPYAEAIAEGDAINKCPPGGESGVIALADLLGVEVIPLEDNGAKTEKTIVIIREDECIGCTKCIQACPVDAIIGAPKQMHTVIADLCTGCDLCIPPCPVDCIDIVEDKPTVRTWKFEHPIS